MYNSYRVSHWGAIFFIPVAILGVFFLFSVLLALFEDAYASQTDEMLGLKRAKYRTALSTSFMLIVRHQELAEETTNTACKVLTKQAFATFMPEFGFDDLELVDNLFDLIDSDSNGFVDLTEFTQILFIARCHALMTSDVLLTHKVVVARWTMLVADAQDTQELLDELPESQATASPGFSRPPKHSLDAFAVPTPSLWLCIPASSLCCRDTITLMSALRVWVWESGFFGDKSISHSVDTCPAEVPC